MFILEISKYCIIMYTNLPFLLIKNSVGMVENKVDPVLNELSSMS
jgi:hypothetical protein